VFGDNVWKSVALFVRFVLTIQAPKPLVTEGTENEQEVTERSGFLCVLGLGPQCALCQNIRSFGCGGAAQKRKVQIRGQPKSAEVPS
jgi:hypothetical protein